MIRGLFFLKYSSVQIGEIAAIRISSAFVRMYIVCVCRWLRKCIRVWPLTVITDISTQAFPVAFSDAVISL